MAARKPLVLVAGEAQQLQAGDTLVDGSGGAFTGGGTPFIAGVSAKSISFTAVTGDLAKCFQVTTGSSTITATLPAAATAGADWYILLQKADAGAGVIATSPAAPNSALLALMEQYDLVVIWTDGTNYYANALAGSFNANSSLVPEMLAISSLRL